MAEQTIFFLPEYFAEPENYNFRPLVTQRLPPLLRGFPVIQLKIKNQYGVLKICHELNFFFLAKAPLILIVIASIPGRLGFC